MDLQQRELFAKQLLELPLVLRLKLQDCYGLDNNFEFKGYTCFMLDAEQAAVGFPGVVAMKGSLNKSLLLAVWLRLPDASENPIELARIVTGIEDAARLSDRQDMRPFARIELPSAGLSLDSCALRFVAEVMKVAAEMVKDLTARMTGDSP